MIPRNLRKPTERRCEFWWNDYLRAWSIIGGLAFQMSVAWDVMDEHADALARLAQC